MNSVSHRIKGIISSIKRIGLLRYIARITRRVLAVVYSRKTSTVYRRDLSQHTEPRPARVPVQIREMSETDLDQVMEAIGAFIRTDKITSRLSRGWRLMLAIYEGEIVSWSWFSRSPMEVESIGGSLNYGELAGYVEGTQTMPSMYGAGLAPAVRAEICRLLKQEGCETVFVCVGDDNKASIAVAKKCGFKEYESLKLSIRFGINHLTRSPIQRSAGAMN